MNAFEVTELDVKQAAKTRLGAQLTDEQAMRIFNRLDLERVSDRAAFESDGDGGTSGDDQAMVEATERAHDEIVRQIKTRSLLPPEDDGN